MSGHSVHQLGNMTTQDFKKYMLYTYPGDHNSDAAEKIARTTDEVQLQNIAALETLPAYVKGVPTVACKKGEFVYTGATCLEFLTQLAAQQIRPAGGPGGFARSGGRAQAFSTGSAVDRLAAGSAVVGFAPGAGGPPTDQRADEGAISRYMARRTQATEQVVAAQKQQGQQARGGRVPAGVRG